MMSKEPLYKPMWYCLQCHGQCHAFFLMIIPELKELTHMSWLWPLFLFTTCIFHNCCLTRMITVVSCIIRQCLSLDTYNTDSFSSLHTIAHTPANYCATIILIEQLHNIVFIVRNRPLIKCCLKVPLKCVYLKKQLMLKYRPLIRFLII
jgi:hypothetical protein